MSVFNAGSTLETFFLPSHAVLSTGFCCIFRMSLLLCQRSLSLSPHLCYPSCYLFAYISSDSFLYLIISDQLLLRLS